MNKIVQIAKRMNVPTHLIKNNNVNSYYFEGPELCCYYKRKPISDNIGPYEFEKAIKYLKDYYKDIKDDYYKNLHKYILENNITNDNILTIKPNQMLDHVITEYVKFRENTFVIVTWPKAHNDFDKVKQILNEHGNIYYIRKLKLNYTAAKNLIYHLYTDTRKLRKLSEIEEKLEFMGWTPDTIANVKIIVFENKSNVRLSGIKAPLKEKIRAIWKDRKDFWGGDFVHVNDHFYQTIEYCQLFLNRNSIMNLHFQNLNKIIAFNDNNNKCRIMINTIKNWIVHNCDPIDYDRFLFFSSVVLYTQGIRSCRDIDGVVAENPVSQTFYEQVNKNFHDKNTKFFFSDIAIQNTRSWDTKWDVQNKVWFESINDPNINTLDNLIFNPNYHFYYNGLKFVTLKIEIHKKLQRGLVKDVADILEITRQTNLKIDKIPKISEKYTKEEFIRQLNEYMQKTYPENKEYVKYISEI